MGVLANHGQTEQKPQRLTVPFGENESTSAPATTVTYHPELDSETHPSPTTIIANRMPSVLPPKKINKIYKEDPPRTTPSEEKLIQTSNLQNPHTSLCTTPAPKLTSDVRQGRAASSKTSKLFEFWRGKSPPIRNQIGNTTGPSKTSPESDWTAAIDDN